MSVGEPAPEGAPEVVLIAGERSGTGEEEQGEHPGGDGARTAMPHETDNRNGENKVYSVGRSYVAAGRAQPDRSHALPPATSSIDKKSARSKGPVVNPVVNRRLKLAHVKAQRVQGDMMLNPLLASVAPGKHDGMMLSPRNASATAEQRASSAPVACGTDPTLQPFFLNMCATLQIS